MPARSRLATAAAAIWLVVLCVLAFLMYRTQLDADAGMLFSWDREQPRSFWMLNTCIPLDMLFIAADGTIVGILEQVPTMNTAPRGVPCAAQHVLEVNAGWTRQHGVVPGQKVSIES